MLRMQKITFYDLSEDQKLAHLNGQALTFGELYKYYISSQPDRCQSLPLSLDKFVAMEFHPYGVGQEGWRSWKKYFSTATQLLCNCLPSEEEMKVVRGCIRIIPNEFKRIYFNRCFVLSFLAYLFIGFKGHACDGFISNSNAVSALVEFILSLHMVDNRILFSSFLCAHRDPKISDELNLLQSHIPPEKIRRAAALVLAITHNVQKGLCGKVVFLQQGASHAAASSIFPEVTVEYLVTGRMYEMLEKLRYQCCLVREVFTALPGPRIRAQLVSLDVLTQRIESFLKRRYGSQWRLINFTSNIYDDDPIVQIGIDMALPEIERMMPFFSGDFRQAVFSKKDEFLEMNELAAYKSGGHELAVLVTQAIEWFIQQHSMTISAKAVYETTFYYLWGKYCNMFKGAFAIGFDREHDRFQHFAWKCGAESEMENNKIHQTVPLYARRNSDGHKQESLTNLSFRQFWR